MIEWNSIVYLFFSYIFFIHLLGCFHVLDSMNDAAMEYGGLYIS